MFQKILSIIKNNSHFDNWKKKKNRVEHKKTHLEIILEAVIGEVVGLWKQGGNESLLDQCRFKWLIKVAIIFFLYCNKFYC